MSDQTKNNPFDVCSTTLQNSPGISCTVVKFTPVTGSIDTMIRGGVSHKVIQRLHCITYMEEYKTKSLEELRLEDYIAWRKGHSSGFFGATAQTSPFGGVVANAGPTNTDFKGMNTGFGITSQAETTGLFSKPLTGFGTSATTTSAFSSMNTKNTATDIFNTQAKPFGATTATSLFSTSNAATIENATFGAIGTQNTGFGTSFEAAHQPNQTTDLFNQNKTTFNLPASTATTSFGFGQTSQVNTGGLFGTKPIETGFGATGFDKTSTPAFSQTAATPFRATHTTNTLFSSNVKPADQTTGFSFGAASTCLGTAGTSSFSTTSKPSLFNATGSNLNSAGVSGIGLSGFGATTNTSPSNNAFGGITTSGFSAARQNGAIGLFSKPLTSFGAPATVTTKAFSFGNTNNSTINPFNPQEKPFGKIASNDLFGSTPSFGNTTVANGPSSSVSKFVPVIDVDTIDENGVSQTDFARYYSITCMNDYKTKSLEELRLEDYEAGRKGQSSSIGSFNTSIQISPFNGVPINPSTANATFGGIAGTPGSVPKLSITFKAPHSTTVAIDFSSANNIFNNQVKPFGSPAITPPFPAANPGVFSLPTSSATVSFNFGLPSQADTSVLCGAKSTRTEFGNAGLETTSTSVIGANRNSSSFTFSFKPTDQTIDLCLMMNLQLQ